MASDLTVLPLSGFSVVTLAVNLPGPLAGARLHDLGATVVKVEPPGGDPLAELCPAWYRAMLVGQHVLQIDAKQGAGAEQLRDLLAGTDLLLTSSRPAALARLQLDWPSLHRTYPRLMQVAIVGAPGPAADRPGHDLTYQAAAGLVDPLRPPLTLLADLAGAERAVTTALALALARERSGSAGYVEIALSDAAAAFAAPLRYGLTSPDGLLGGRNPGYCVYRASDGWIAVACLEEHFWERLLHELQPVRATKEDLQHAFAKRTASEWQQWALERDLPIVALADGATTSAMA